MEYIAYPFVTYISNWKKIISTFQNIWYYHRPDSLGPSGWYQFFYQEYRDTTISCSLDTEFILCMIAVALAFTVIRFICHKLFLDKIPIWLDMNEESRDKFPESFFRLITYICIWSCSAYVLLFSEYPLMEDPVLMWSDFSGVSTKIPPDVFFIYVLQCGYYVHCVYANTVLDVHRTDFWALMLHHVVTLILISFSYAARYHNVGIIVFFIHDICDIFLEIAKCGRYLLVLGGKEHKLPHIISLIAFVIFSSLWVWLRLYWYQTKVLMGSAVASMQLDMSGEFYLMLNGLLLVLYGLNSYWFCFILLVAYDIITGEELVDKREIELNEKSNQEALQRKEKEKEKEKEKKKKKT